MSEEKFKLPGGATRSERAPAYHLVPGEGNRRTALRFGLGAEKHGPWNWIRSLDTPAHARAFANEAYNHMIEHANKMKDRADPEDDHLGAIGWAQAALAFIEAKFNCKWTDLPTGEEGQATHERR
jgi:hypothetical protein